MRVEDKGLKELDVILNSVLSEIEVAVLEEGFTGESASKVFEERVATFLKNVKTAATKQEGYYVG